MNMVEAEKIAEVMGLTSKVHSLFDLTESVINGLPKKTLAFTVKCLTKDLAEGKKISDRLVPPATYKRRKTVLNMQESERVERLARVYATTLDVWGDEEDARRFLFTPHRLLNSQKPIDLAFIELGARQIEQILEKLRYGLPV